MDYHNKKYDSDYRVNVLSDGTVISVEVTCCGKHIGEIRFKNGESKKCPVCDTVHSIIIQHNHFHIRPLRAASQDLNRVTTSSLM